MTLQELPYQDVVVLRRAHQSLKPPDVPGGGETGGFHQAPQPEIEVSTGINYTKCHMDKDQDEDGSSHRV